MLSSSEATVLCLPSDFKYSFIFEVKMSASGSHFSNLIYDGFLKSLTNFALFFIVFTNLNS